MLPKTVLQIIRRNNLFSPKDHIVLAISGGVDSIALLHVINALKDELDITIYVATFDHMLRDDSGDDVDFVVESSQLLGLPAYKDSDDVHALAKAEKISIETAARKARYKFLAEVAHQTKSSKIVTAHHRDDQAETVLMRLIRGTGLQGLKGMTPISPVPNAPDLQLVRPFLSISKKTLTEYCESEGIQYRFDETNKDTDYTRNYIRHEVMPRLHQINPEVESAIAQLSDIVSVEDSFIDSVINQVSKNLVAQQQKERIYLKRPVFETLHPALQRRCLMKSLADLLQDGEQVDYKHILHAIEVSTEGQVGAIAQFPNQLHLRVDYDYLVIEPQDASITAELDQPLLEEGQSIPLKIPGTHSIEGQKWILKITVTTNDERPQAQLSVSSYTKCILRTRRQGDRFQPLGLSGHSQKLKKWMIDHKVPQYLRDRIPILVLDGEVAAVILKNNWAISEKFKVSNQNQQICNFFIYFS